MVIGFTIENDGAAYRCTCNLGAFALLITALRLGASAFINISNGRPYLKVCGQMKQSAGIVFGRIVAGCEEGEDVTYANGNTLDLRYSNVVPGRANPRTKRGRVEFYGEVLIRPDTLVQGTPAENHELRNMLLKKAFELLDAEI
jgi:hypothetical protein